MDEPDIAGWFDDHWMRARDLALQEGWESLPRRDQVLVTVGFLLDSCVGDGVWAIVDGVVEGSDEGLTIQMPDALELVGLPRAADHIRQIVRLRSLDGSPEERDANRTESLVHWHSIRELFDEWVPDGERVMLTRLYEWYAQTR